MQAVSQGFYGSVWRDDRWAIKHCTSAQQCVDELNNIRFLQRYNLSASGIERVAPDQYRYPWINGEVLSCCPEQQVLAQQSIQAVHRVHASHYFWAGICDRKWWRCFLRWVLSWFHRLESVMKPALWQSIKPMLSHICPVLMQLKAAPTLVHGDPHPENIIISGESAVLIDPGIVGFAVPELDWAMYMRPGFPPPDGLNRAAMQLMRIFLDLWHWQRTLWRDHDYLFALINDYHALSVATGE